MGWIDTGKLLSSSCGKRSDVALNFSNGTVVLDEGVQESPGIESIEQPGVDQVRREIPRR